MAHRAIVTALLQGRPPLDVPMIAGVSVAIRRSRRARRVALRVTADRAVELVIPERAALATAIRFLEERRSWVEQRLLQIPERIPFAAGAVIPVLGVERVLVHAGATRGIPPFRLTGSDIEIGGDPNFMARRTRAGLMRLARDTLSSHSIELAARLDSAPRAIAVGDPQSRWGSCNARGQLRFSWRLVMAPEPVLRYVAAHEVAHLVEMNHSSAFWALVERLVPGHHAQRLWLKRNGASLRRYG